MDFPFAVLTPKGQVKVREGHLESLFDHEDRDKDCYEDNIMRDIDCLTTIGTDFDRKFRIRIFESFFQVKIFEPAIQ